MQRHSPRRLAVVREGRVLIYIPDPRGAVTSGRLEPAWLDVFYNPAMEVNRDLSVVTASLLLEEMRGKRDLRVLDAHGGTGIRGIRYVVEAGAEEAIINDIDPYAAALAHANARLNGVTSRVRITVADANALMYRLKREEPTPIALIDIDPYGSPAPFLHAALDLAGHGSIVAVTATDLAVLEGSKPKKAFRRYMVEVYKTPSSREVAVRALLAFIAKTAAIFDKGVEPLMSVYHGHFIRVFVKVQRGASRAEKSLSQLKHAYHCINLGVVVFDEAECNGNKIALGPLWSGPLGDANIALKALSNLSEDLGSYKSLKKLLSHISVEYTFPPSTIYYSIAGISSSLKVSMPSRRLIIEELKSRGYRASETHFSPEGFRADAPPQEVVEIIKELSPSARNR